MSTDDSMFQLDEKLAAANKSGKSTCVSVSEVVNSDAAGVGLDESDDSETHMLI